MLVSRYFHAEHISHTPKIKKTFIWPAPIRYISAVHEQLAKQENGIASRTLKQFLKHPG
jgi:hypothetical protein